MTLEQFAEQINGKVWRKGDKIRIYFETEKKTSAYIDYDEDLGDEFQTGMEGGRLRVFSNNDRATTKWNVNNAKQIKHGIMATIAEITGEEICESWQDVIL